MHNKTYIWLGSRRTKRKGANPAARRLDFARNASLPVPAGIILLDEAWHFAREHDWIVVKGTQVSFREPDLARELIMAASFDQPVQVTPTLLQPKPDLSAYHALVTKGDEFAAAVAQSWSQALRQTRTVDSRLDLIVHEVVQAVHKGSAATQAGYGSDQYWLAPAYENRQLSRQGTEPGRSYLTRLKRLLRGVRTTFGDQNWLIEWADDGTVCWLTGIWEITPTWERTDKYIPWPLLDGVPLPADFSINANAIWQETLGLTSSRTVCRWRAGHFELNLSYLLEYWQMLGLNTAWDQTAGQFVTNEMNGWQLWRRPRLAGRLVTWRRQLASWLAQEMEKPHDLESLSELAVRFYIRWQLVALTGRSQPWPEQLSAQLRGQPEQDQDA